MWMNQQIKKSFPIVIRLLSFIGLFPNRLILVRIGPQKLMEFDEIVRMANLNPNDSVLDMGCGRGLQTLLLGKESKDVVGIDLSSQSIKAARALANASRLSSKVRFSQGNVVEADFEENSYTKVVSFCVLEHIPDWQHVLKKAYKWLAPGGCLVISVDSLATIKDDEVLKIHRKDHSVVTYFNKQTLTSALRDAGFSHVEMHSILRSRHAAEEFTREVMHSSSGGSNLLRQLVEYYRLRKAETEAPNQDDGIFLVAKAMR